MIGLGFDTEEEERIDRRNRFIHKILCFIGLHVVGETQGMYCLGKCIHCGLEDMWF
jgi:hypothetical protein